MRYAVILVALSAVFGGHAVVQAAEVDEFTGRPSSLNDALTVLNRETNRRLRQAVEEANSVTRVMSSRRYPKTSGRVWSARQGLTYCNRHHLLVALEGIIAGPLIGQVETFAEESPQIDRHRVPFADSIYQDFEFEETPSIAGSERMSSVIQLDGVLIGTDKLGHFFTEGLSYYEELQKSTVDWADVQMLGAFMESTYFGAVTTGVYSFADLAVNYNGALFWLRFWGHQRVDGMDLPPGPRVSCRSGRWYLSGEFDWHDYVDGAWDEGLNCVMIRNEVLLSKVAQRLNGERCPLAPLPAAVKQKYGKFQENLLNTQGHRVLPPQLEPDRMVERYLLNGSEASEWRRWVVRKVKQYYRRWELELQAPPPASD